MLLERLLSTMDSQNRTILDMKTQQESARQLQEKAFMSMSAQLSKSTNEVIASVRSAAADVAQRIISNTDNRAKREYPCVYLMVPQSKPKGVFNILSNLGKVAFDCYCLCEFQCESEDSDLAPLWHPVGTDVGPFSKTVKQPTEFVKKLAPILKATYVALKVGVCVARVAGVPVPDVSQFIPQDMLNIGGSIMEAISSSSDLSNAVAGIQDKIQTSVSQDDSAVIEAVKSGQMGGARLRPNMLQGPQLAMVKALFGEVQVCAFTVVVSRVDDVVA